MSDFFAAAQREDEGDLSSNCSTDSEDYREGMTKDLMEMILQFMQASGFSESYKTFSRECTSCGFKLSKRYGDQSVCDAKAEDFGAKDIALLYKAIDEEDEAELTRLWLKFSSTIESLFPKPNAGGDGEDYKSHFENITFFIRIYISTIPFRLQQPKEHQIASMAKLRDFFEQKTDQMSSSAELLTLFALPFVADPQSHPVFRKLFRNSWKNKLKAQINLVLAKYCKVVKLPTVSECDLVQLYFAASDKEEQDRSITVRSKHSLPQVSSRNENYQYFQQQLKHLDDKLIDTEIRYHKLLKVCAEMVSALENATNGRENNVVELKSRVVAAFPELFESIPIQYRHENPAQVQQENTANEDYEPGIVETEEKLDSESGLPLENSDVEDLLNDNLAVIASSIPQEAVNNPSETEIIESNENISQDVCDSKDKQVEKSQNSYSAVESQHNPLQQPSDSDGSLLLDQSFEEPPANIVHAVPVEKDCEKTTSDMLITASKKAELARKQPGQLIRSTNTRPRQSFSKNFQKVTEAKIQKFAQKIKLKGPMPLTPRGGVSVSPSR